MRKIEEAAPGHVREVRRLVVDRLSGEQLRALGDATRAVVSGMDPRLGERLGSDLEPAISRLSRHLAPRGLGPAPAMRGATCTCGCTVTLRGEEWPAGCTVACGVHSGLRGAQARADCGVTRNRSRPVCGATATTPKVLDGSCHGGHPHARIPIGLRVPWHPRHGTPRAARRRRSAPAARPGCPQRHRRRSPSCRPVGTRSTSISSCA